jgi:hypothetical protein
MAKDTTQSQKEIVTVLNNAVAATLRPARLGPIPEARLKRLHEVAKAIIAPAVELVEPDETGTTILEPEELVAIMAVAALYTHLTVVMKTARVPFGGLSKEIFD